eukprot:GHVS01029948.1.p1 GENE.GHVS01029948.1~~GHVS01029948.1.p1  ORF type:complete len:305 (+),score=20.67 GHVS01029948.1:419-1333(+)
MGLLELTEGASLPFTWALLFGLAWLFAMFLSSCTFYFLFWKPTYKLWVKKSNPNYPLPTKVREEIVQMNKGIVFSSFTPALTVWLAHRGFSKGYGGRPESWLQELGAQLCYLLMLDFFEFLYHYGTHRLSSLWQFHKYHHTFPNPSPFAVIADEVVDQLVRSSPMVFIPLFLPLNVDIMFIVMALFSYGYGTYLHCGHELDYPDAHHPFINTSYHHYCHHAVSILNKPYHCGFMLSIFDRIAGSMYRDRCMCAKCCDAKGERTLEKWNQLHKPDYSVMLTGGFWIEALSLEFRKLKEGTFMRVT